MRKTAFLLPLVVLLATSITTLSAQLYTYIRYDESMDRLDHQFLGANSSTMYTSYRVTKNANEKVFLDIGIESPHIAKKEPPSMVSSHHSILTREFVEGINTGRRKVYVCKKLDSGWAVQIVGSASYLSNFDNLMTYISPHYDFQVDFKQSIGNNLSLNTDPNKTSAIYYTGEMPVCNNKSGYTFKVTPIDMTKAEVTLSILPDLGLLREHSGDCPTYELVGINRREVCSYLGGSSTAAPVITHVEPTPEPVPSSYSTVTTSTYVPTTTTTSTYVPLYTSAYVPVETSVAENTDTYVKSKTIVEHNNITRSDAFEETTTAAPAPAPETVPSSYNYVEKPKPAKVECAAVAKKGEHVVQTGESLYGIARTYGLNINVLRSWNALSGDVIYPCTILKTVAPPTAKVEKASMEVTRTNDVPASYNTVVKVTPKKVEKPVVTKVVECEVEYTEGEHVVLQSENLYGIARKYNVSIENLKAWNNLPNDIIKPCQKLVIAAPKAVITPKVVDIPKTYNVIVKPKAVSALIAAPKKVVATKAIVTTKSVTIPKTTTVISTKIPAAYIKKGSGLHVVAKGETVSSLAKHFEMSEADFRKINYFSTKEIVYVGQVVRTQNCACNIAVEDDNALILKPVTKSDVPANYNIVTSKSGKTETTVTSKGISTRKYHVVQPTETLFTVAKLYGKSVSEIRKLNNLTESDSIIANQLLVLE